MLVYGGMDEDVKVSELSILVLECEDVEFEELEVKLKKCKYFGCMVLLFDFEWVIYEIWVFEDECDCLYCE